MDRKKTVACLSVLLCAACTRPARVVVGSKNFSEQVLIGEILARQIERAGIPVERKLNLGGTLLAHESLVNGSIDLYPEYTGTALTAVLKQPPSGDSAAVERSVREAYLRRWRLVWLAPLGFNNTFAMIVRGDTARSEKLATLSDAARAHPWRLGVGYEFKQRPDGLDGLVKTYGLKLQDEPVTMDLGLLYSALQGRKVDLIAANSTDGLAASLDVTILADDRHYFPPYDCAVVVREETLDRFPKLRDVLGRLSGRLPDAIVRKLNGAIDGQHRPPSDVAADFLSTLDADGK